MAARAATPRSTSIVPRPSSGLEEEQRKEFVEYLERLRQAKDKQEFDQFMADRRGRPGSGLITQAASET